MRRYPCWRWGSARGAHGAVWRRGAQQGQPPTLLLGFACVEALQGLWRWPPVRRACVPSCAPAAPCGSQLGRAARMRGGGVRGAADRARALGRVPLRGSASGQHAGGRFPACRPAGMQPCAEAPMEAYLVPASQRRATLLRAARWMLWLRSLDALAGLWPGWPSLLGGCYGFLARPCHPCADHAVPAQCYDGRAGRKGL